jgi:hypothetical protein
MKLKQKIENSASEHSFHHSDKLDLPMAPQAEGGRGQRDFSEKRSEQSVNQDKYWDDVSDKGYDHSLVEAGDP